MKYAGESEWAYSALVAEETLALSRTLVDNLKEQVNSFIHYYFKLYKQTAGLRILPF